MGQKSSKNKEIEQLADCTHFNLQELEILSERFSGISESLQKGRSIKKEQLAQSLGWDNRKGSFFVDRLFLAFCYVRPMGAFAKPGAAKDGKGQLPSQPTLGMVQFVMGLSVFSEKASLAEKAAFMFQMYDVRQQNSISKEDLRLLVDEMVTEACLELPAGAIDSMVESTMLDADPLSTGGISRRQFEALIARFPGIASHMTLPALSNLVPPVSAAVQQ